MIRLVATFAALIVMTPVHGSGVLYQLDPNHTYPSFEADHLGGLSVWRGKFRSTKGTVRLDRSAGKGELEVTIDAASVDFGHDRMNEHARGTDLFDVAKYPTAMYRGRLVDFNAGVPGAVEGELTLLGVTRPVRLVINSFMCKQHPLRKKEVCGADASAVFNRFDFGMTYGQQIGFKPQVKLAIQVEALRAD